MKYKFVALLIIFSPSLANAATYAWSESVGYFDFTNVVVSDNSLSGYAYNDNTGFLNMTGVSNDGNGDLSGYAWSESVGYFNFANVSIASKLFNGSAYNDNTGFLNMSGVTTAWAPTSRFSGSSIPKRVVKLESQNRTEEAQNLRDKYPAFFQENLFKNRLQSLDLEELNEMLKELRILLKPKTPTATPTEYYRDLEQGMEGGDVKQLQNYLINQGYSIPAGATGFFGPQTESALISFQKDKDITPAAGYFGPITRSWVINN